MREGLVKLLGLQGSTGIQAPCLCLSTHCRVEHDMSRTSRKNGSRDIPFVKSIQLKAFEFERLENKTIHESLKSEPY